MQARGIAAEVKHRPREMHRGDGVIGDAKVRMEDKARAFDYSVGHPKERRFLHRMAAINHRSRNGGSKEGIA